MSRYDCVLQPIERGFAQQALVVDDAYGILSRCQALLPVSRQAAITRGQRAEGRLD
nr:hypothetical protein [Methylobacterium sp. Leaf122]